jgi:HNH endonuclease
MARPRNLALWGDCPHCGKEFKRKSRFRKNGTYNGLQQQTYCSGTCRNLARESKGYCLDKHGYKILTAGRKNGYCQPEHRAVMEKMIGRKLTKQETVHHKNGIRHDNRPENLELWSSRHGRGQRVDDQVSHHLAAIPGVFSGVLSMGV